MKFLLSALLSLNLGLTDEQLRELNQSFDSLFQVYSQIPMDDVVDKHYFINFTSEQNALDEELAQTDCKNTSNFNPVTSKVVTQAWFKQIQKAATLGLQGRKRQQVLIRADRALMRIENIFSKTELEWCHHFEIAPYSDGHTKSFVRIKNGTPIFMFEEGFPD